MAPRTIIYIDGLNLYHGAIKGTLYKWLDIEQYFRLLRPDDNLQSIKYFTALISGPHRTNQKTFIRALETRPLLTVVLGVFKQKRIRCEAQCHQVFERPEEKRTDVNIAVSMVDDAYQRACHHQILISGDSDLVPPVKMIRTRFPNIKITVYVPARAPQRGRSAELCGAAHKHRVLPLTLLQRAQFPRQVSDGAGGVIEKPASW